jgi:hypothetical protein
VPRFVTPPAKGVWKQIRRAQSLGFAEGMAGRGGHWYAVGIGAWGLLRLRSMAAERTEILLSEPLRPGEEMTITHHTTTRAEFAKRQKQAQREGKQLQKQAQAAEKAAKKARRGLSRAERRQLAAQEAKEAERARRRRRRRGR